MNIQSKYKVLIIRLITLLIFLSISRMLLYILNPSLFGNITWTEPFALWFYGLRFDISALFMINGVFVLLYLLPFSFSSNKKYTKVTDILAITANSLAILINSTDAVYFRFTLRRTSYDIFNFLTINNGFMDLIPSFIIDFWYIPLIWAAMTWLLAKIYFSIGKEITKPITDTKFYIKHTALFIFAAGIIVLGIRGGFQLKPINLIDAVNYTNANKVPLILNTTFTIVKTVDGKSLEKKSYFTENELSTIYTPEHFFVTKDSLPRKKMNVVVIILESFSAEHFRFFNKNIQNGEYLGFTPFLDSLFEKSLVFKGIANVKRSIEGIPAIISGLPNLMNQSFITSPYAGNKVNSLAQILKLKGYYTAFYHGGKNGTMNFNAYTQLAGFDQYFGKNEYNNNSDFDGKWGIWDEKYFQYFAKEMDNMQQPFFTTIFSLSSHHPYKIPKEHKGKFREGELPIQQSVMYADFALKRFFKTASQMQWYQNTIFVITADHTSEGALAFYKNSVGQYQIPIAFFVPSDSTIKQRKTRKTVQQNDIFPSVLDYLNVNSSYIAFGNSVFDTLAPDFGISYSNNYVQLIKDNYLLRFAKNETKELFNLQSDSLLINNLVEKNNPVQQNMEHFLKAYIQQYNNRMIENKLSL